MGKYVFDYNLIKLSLILGIAFNKVIMFSLSKLITIKAGSQY